jgi:hypothetical protein
MCLLNRLTLKLNWLRHQRACPFMPYDDPLRPCVNYWFASSEGANVHSFARPISEANQDRLEDEGGACIMYTQISCGFY